MSDHSSLPHDDVTSEPSEEPPVGEGSRRAVSPLVAGAVGVAVGAGLALAIGLPIVAGLAESPGSEVLASAIDACGSPEGVSLEDNGSTLAFDHRGEDDISGGDIADIMCVFTELEMPSRISTHMGQTTSMDGRQSDTWDRLEVQWSYHPDRGMDGVVVVLEE